MSGHVKQLYQAGGVLLIATSVTVVALKSGYQSDKEIAALLQSPAVTEQWLKHTSSTLPKQSTIKELPLIKQAGLFANFLDPPKPRPVAMADTRTIAQRKRPATGHPFDSGPPVRPAQVSPQFVLLATSCYPADPLKSLALIDEPGRGQRWIRPGTRMGHLIVDEIDTGSIVYRDGDARHTMLRTTAEKGTPDADGKPGRPSVTGQGETYAQNVSNTKVTARSRDVSPVQPSIKRPAFQRLGPKR